jgi:flagellum-specific peptidoglycan hydrolase FlgJ
MDPERQKRLNEMAAVAAKVEAETATAESPRGVPGRLITAAWAVESQWGVCVAGRFNCFGIKRAARHSMFVPVLTHEVFTDAQLADWNRKHPDRPARMVQVLPNGRKNVLLTDYFADYPSLLDAARDYAWLISHGGPYAAAWRRYQSDGDVDALIAGIAGAYSTSPQYAELVTTIAGQANVRAAIQEAQG